VKYVVLRHLGEWPAGTVIGDDDLIRFGTKRTPKGEFEETCTDEAPRLLKKGVIRPADAWESEAASVEVPAPVNVHLVPAGEVHPMGRAKLPATKPE
jgi:hypothetical protein